MINFEDPYVFWPIIIFTVIIILLLTDKIKFNLVKQQEGFSVDKLNHEIISQKKMMFSNSNTGDFDKEKVDKMINTFKKLDERHTLDSIKMINIYNTQRGPDKETARNELMMYKNMKDAIKDSIEYAKNIRDNNSKKSSISPNNNDEFLEESV